MKSTILLFMSMLILSMPAYGSYYYNAYIEQGNNPGNLNQDPTFPGQNNNPPPGWSFIDELATASNPTWSNEVSLPFTFNFNGNDYDHVRVSNSGVVTFSDDPGSPTPFGNVSLPNEEVPDNSICILGVTPNWQAGSDFARVITKTFGTAPNRQFWISYNSYGATSMANNGWLVFSIALEESTNHVYIVDQRSGNSDGLGLSLGIQIDQDNAASVDGSPNVGSYAGTSGEGTNNTYYKFVQGDRPDNEVSLREIIVPTYVSVTDDPVEIKGYIRNFGSEPLTSLTASYTIEGGDEVSEIVNIPNLGTNESMEFTHPQFWAPEEAGKVTVELTISNPNGESDPSPEENSDFKEVRIAEKLVNRRALVETFTSSTCPPCKPGAENLEAAFSTIRDHYVAIRYQVNWPGAGDPYFTQEVNNRRLHYEVTSAPHTAIEGTNRFNPAGRSPQNIRADIIEASNIPAFVDIDGNASFSDDKTVNFNLNITSYVDLPQGLRLQAAIVEKVTYKNVATNGQTEFHTVMKKMVPNENGTVLPAIGINETHNHSDSYTFQGEYRLPANSSDMINHNIEHSVEDFTNLKLVVFVQDHSSLEVFQAFKTDIDHPGQLQDNVIKASFSVYPNPASEMLNVDISGMNNASIMITNLQGQVIYQSPVSVDEDIHTINTSDFSEGMYLINVQNNEHSVTEKVFITR